MPKHETRKRAVAVNYVAILRNWREIDPKVLVGFASSITVTGVITAGASLGWDVPTWAAGAIVAGVYGLTAYWTKTKIPVADDSGLSAQQALAAAAAVDAGVDLAGGDVEGAVAGAFHAAGYTLDEHGNVVGGPEDGPAVIVQPSPSDVPPAQNTLAP